MRSAIDVIRVPNGSTHPSGDLVMILVVGGLVVGPEFGPMAGLCVAIVQLRGKLARRSGSASRRSFFLVRRHCTYSDCCTSVDGGELA